MTDNVLTFEEEKHLKDSLLHLENWKISNVQDEELRKFFEDLSQYSLEPIRKQVAHIDTLKNMTTSVVHSEFFNYCSATMKLCAQDYYDLVFWIRKYFIVRSMLAENKESNFEVLYDEFLDECKTNEIGLKLDYYESMIKQVQENIQATKATDVQIRSGFIGATEELFDNILRVSNAREHVATLKESSKWISGYFGAVFIKDLLEIAKKIRPIDRNAYELKVSDPVLVKYEVLVVSVNGWRENSRALQLEIARQTRQLYKE